MDEKLEDILKSIGVGVGFGAVFPIMGYMGISSGSFDSNPNLQNGLYCLGMFTAINVGVTYYRNCLSLNNGCKESELNLDYKKTDPQDY